MPRLTRAVTFCDFLLICHTPFKTHFPIIILVGIEISDRDLKTVIKQLSRDDLQNLYIELELTAGTVQKAEYRANTTDVELKAMEVLREWRRDKGPQATKTAILDALTECNKIEVVEELTKIWKGDSDK